MTTGKGRRIVAAPASVGFEGTALRDFCSEVGDCQIFPRGRSRQDARN